MSGGIDSSATCIMLQEQGYEVVGVTMRTWDIPSHFSTPEQEQPDEILEAKALAERLGIEHHVADVREEFRNVIVQYFIDEYMKGRTPNPCVMCNPLFKERILCEWADRTGCAQIATGHYCRLEDRKEHRYIVTGDDPTKDQSYFLWKLPQEILKRMVFPLGGMTKTEVRAYLAEKGFEAKAKGGESMEVCFIDKDYRDIFERTLSGYRRTNRNRMVCRQQRTEVRSAQRFRLLYYRTAQRTGNRTRTSGVCSENQPCQKHSHAGRCRTVESRVYACRRYKCNRFTGIAGMPRPVRTNPLP